MYYSHQAHPFLRFNDVSMIDSDNNKLTTVMITVSVCQFFSEPLEMVVVSATRPSFKLEIRFFNYHQVLFCAHAACLDNADPKRIRTEA
jgi:hypothetical protein